jgi:hypothetical protein
MTRLAKDLAQVAAMTPPELREAWQALGIGRCPTLPAGLLRRLLAQQVQERRLGRLPAVVMRELERVAVGEATTGVPSRAPTLSQGTRLIREWNGRTIAVVVLEKGFQWEDQTYGVDCH